MSEYVALSHFGMTMRSMLFLTMASLAWVALVWPIVGKAQSIGEVVLQTTGTLEAGDATLDDGSLYDEYPFEGQAGQAVIVTLQSDAFDTYLLLVNSEGESVAQNDDWNGATDSTIGYVLPEDGTYQVWASAFNESGRGAYDIDISFAEPGHPIVLEAQADRLNQQGMSLLNRGEYLEAQTMFEQSLAIRQDVGDRRGEGESLNNIGGIYDSLGDYPKALDFYEQSLAISQDIGDRRGEGTMLNNIGYALEALNYPVLAIVYFKKSVNVFEMIRTSNQTLTQEQQQSFTETIASSYRKLADLLLQQDRVLEAQRVLDLLKVQELDDYLRGVRSETTTASGIDLLPQEAEFWTDKDNILAQAIPIATELQALRQIPFPNRSPEQNTRILTLENQQSQILNQFIAFIESPDVQQLISNLSRTAQQQDILAELNRFPTLQDNLADIGDAVLLYPLILEDRLELVLVTPDGPPTRHPVTVPREQLTQTIADFQQALRDKNSSPEALAQQL
ncbi:MAG: tetratricopeptide repeat protein, partial [Phormidesmis sp.]